MGYVYLLVIFMTPVLINLSFKKYKFVTVKNIVIVSITIILIVMPKFLFFKTATVYNGVADSPIEKFLYRALALQGEVWWGTDNLCINRNTNNLEQIDNEINAFIDEEKVYNSGIWYLSYLLIPNYNHNDSLATLNCGHPAILIEIFGYVGAIFVQIICGIIFGIITVILKRKIEKEQYLSIFFIYAIWMMTYNSFYMGGIWYYGGNTMKISVIGAIASEIFYASIKKKKMINNRL